MLIRQPADLTSQNKETQNILRLYHDKMARQIKNNFQEKVYKLLQRIPRGRATTYQAIAYALGNKNLSRAVGNALKRNPHPIIVPCHRVVKSDGNLGGFSLGLKKKIELLKKEGLQIKAGKIIDFKKRFFKFEFFLF